MTDQEAPPLRPWQVWGRFMKGCGNTIHEGDRPWDCEECLGPMLEALDRSFRHWGPKLDPWAEDPGDELDLRIQLDNERTAAVALRAEIAQLRAIVLASGASAAAGSQALLEAVKVNAITHGQNQQANEDEIARLKRVIADYEKRADS